LYNIYVQVLSTIPELFFFAAANASLFFFVSTSLENTSSKLNVALRLSVIYFMISWFSIIFGCSSLPEIIDIQHFVAKTSSFINKVNEFLFRLIEKC